MGLITQATIVVKPTDLLSSIWYSDGSGAGQSVGLDSTPDSWKLVAIWKAAGLVFIRIEREES